MPLPFDRFQGKGVFDFDFDFDFSPFSPPSSSSPPNSLPEVSHQKWEKRNREGNWCYVGIEPTSVLDARRSPSPPTSSSTLSSSHGGGASADAATKTTGVAAADLSSEKCGQLRMEDWDGVLPGSPSQEQSILRLIMGEIEDPSVVFNKLLQAEKGSQDMDFNAGFGVVDQGFGFENISSSNLINSIDPSLQIPSDFPLLTHNARIGVFNQNPNFVLPQVEEKPHIVNPPFIINQNQSQFCQNPAMFLPLSYAQFQDHHLLSPQSNKRLNPGPNGPSSHPPKIPPVSDSRLPELFLQRPLQHQLQMQQQRRQGMMKQKLMTPTDEQNTTAQQLQQAVIHPICQAAELIETGNPALAQGILARLNHQLSMSIGKPQIRAAFYFKEALQYLLHNNINPSSVSPCSLIFKIGAFKSFSEISPILQFSNFTCNQAILEACDGFDTIHIIDFDIGYGAQWASLMQELALPMRNGSCPSLKITAIASHLSHDELELGFTRESLKLFANEINIPFELEIISIESLISGSYSMPVMGLSDKQVIAVNLPISPFSNYPSSLPVVLRFVKQLSPKIVVSLDRNCDRTDLPFAHHVNHCIQSYSSLLESLEAVNMNSDALMKIEKFLIQQEIEKIVLGRHQNPDRTSPWRSLFIQYGFTPFQFSNFAESQAECLVQRTPVRGFFIQKKQSSLVLCWQRKELVSASAWRC